MSDKRLIPLHPRALFGTWEIQLTVACRGTAHEEGRIEDYLWREDKRESSMACRPN